MNNAQERYETKPLLEKNSNVGKKIKYSSTGQEFSGELTKRMKNEGR